MQVQKNPQTDFQGRQGKDRIIAVGQLRFVVQFRLFVLLLIELLVLRPLTPFQCLAGNGKFLSIP
jgi:hypothetical protein